MAAVQSPWASMGPLTSSQGPQISPTATLHSTVESSLVSSTMSTDSSFVASGQLPTEVELLFRRIFRLCDVARSGGFNECELMLSCAQHRDVAGFFGLPRAFKDEDGSLIMATKMFQAIDADDDHEITWEEFRTFFAARFATVLAMQQQQMQAKLSQAEASSDDKAEQITGVPPVPELETLTTKASDRSHGKRQESCCRHCGRHVGWVLGFGGCGFALRLHEARCPGRSFLGKLQPDASKPRSSSHTTRAGSSVMTDVPEDSAVQSGVLSTQTESALESTLRASR